MRTGTKFVNTDILKAMQTIVDGHVKHYQSDFEFDIKTLKEASTKTERTERIFVWMCRECGTWLLNEKNVFIQESHEYSVFTYYAEQTRDAVLCFVVEVTGVDGGTVKGNLYAHDYKKFYEHVRTAAVQAGSIVFRYERGQRMIQPSEHFNTLPDAEYGKYESFQFQPESPEQLECVLMDEKRTRNRFKEDYEILCYELYEYPKSPTENGKYYGKTPVLEQAECIVRSAEEAGQQLFIKAVCSDGKKRYI